MHKITNHLDIVTRHDLGAKNRCLLQQGCDHAYHPFRCIESSIREVERHGNISSSQKELWAVIVHEWSVATAYEIVLGTRGNDGGR
jgi:hypothetical protein